MRTTVKRLLLDKGASYSLRDEFNTDVTAGSVNSSSAVPGPGTRSVTDTNSIISVSGGALVIDGTGAANDGLIYAQESRAAGKALGFSVPSRTTAGAELRFGWSSSNLSNSNIENGIDYGGAGANTVRIKDGVSVRWSKDMGAGAHRFVCLMRATGGYLFGKTASGEWLLLWVYPSTSAAQYPKFYAGNAAHDITLDDIRIKDTKWLPVPIVSDGYGSSFGTADGLGHAETSGIGSGGSGKPYTDRAGTWTINSGAAECATIENYSGADNGAIATVECSASDVIIHADLTRSANVAGVIARWEDNDNYLVAFHNGTNAVLQQRVGGSLATLINAAAAYSAGATIRLHLQGTTARLFYNSAQVGTAATVPSSTETAHGIFSDRVGNQVDNFVVYALGSDGEYANLESV